MMLVAGKAIPVQSGDACFALRPSGTCDVEIPGRDRRTRIPMSLWLRNVAITPGVEFRWHCDADAIDAGFWFGEQRAIRRIRLLLQPFDDEWSIELEADVGAIPAIGQDVTVRAATPVRMVERVHFLWLEG